MTFPLEAQHGRVVENATCASTPILTNHHINLEVLNGSSLVLAQSCCHGCPPSITEGTEHSHVRNGNGSHGDFAKKHMWREGGWVRGGQGPRGHGQ